jgi:hypothetical protein
MVVAQPDLLENTASPKGYGAIGRKTGTGNSSGNSGLKRNFRVDILHGLNSSLRISFSQSFEDATIF